MRGFTLTFICLSFLFGNFVFSNPEEVSGAVDYKSNSAIKDAKAAIEKEDWVEATRLLQSVLDQNESWFKNEKSDRVDLQEEANAILAKLPPAGMEVYQLKEATHAKNMLEEALKKGPDYIALEKLATQYRLTPSGQRALYSIAMWHVDRGRYYVATPYFEKLMALPNLETKPFFWIAAAIAYRGQHNFSKSAEMLSKLKEILADKPLVMGNTTWKLSEIEAEILKTPRLYHLDVAYLAKKLESPELKDTQFAKAGFRRIGLGNLKALEKDHPEHLALAKIREQLFPAVRQAWVMRHPQQIATARFSEDGKTVVYVDKKVGIHIHDALTGEMQRQIRLSIDEDLSIRVYRAALSKDLRYLAYDLTASDKDIHIWDIEKNTEVQTLVGHKELLKQLVYSPQGDLLLSVGGDKTIRVWEIATGKELQLLKGHKGAVYGGCFSADGRFILTTGEDGTIRLWETKTGTELKKFNHGSLSAIFTADAQHVVSAGADQFVRIFNLETGKEETAFKAPLSLSAVAVSPNGDRFLSGMWKNGLWMTTSEGKELWKISDGIPPISEVSYSPNGKLMMDMNSEGSLRVWDLEYLD